MNSINPEEIDGNVVKKPHFIFNCFRAPSSALFVVYRLYFTCTDNILNSDAVLCFIE